MAKAPFVLAIDQGTTSTRAIVFDADAQPVSVAQLEFPQHYPELGWVEHDPEDIWSGCVSVMRQAMAQAGLEASQLAGVGITNQRETVVVWERSTGRPIHRAIVWQDRRTADLCADLRAAGLEEEFASRTGLLLDPYFSGTKLKWVLDHVPGARAMADRGELAFGTIDSFLLWRLTGGKAHGSDPTNAGRTLLFDILRQEWSQPLLEILSIPASLLPEVKDNSGLFGYTDPAILGAAVKITGMVADQQAALFGQACFKPGMAKATYGTGCFMLMNTGEKAVRSQNRLLTTPAYRLGGRTTYALEGSIFVAGAAVKWLRDSLGLITHASQTHDMATRVPDSHGVYLVPAFVGLGAPHWTPRARAVISGLTFDAGPAHLARAALESVAFQTVDLTDAMAADGGTGAAALRVDGGMAANDWLCQFLADMLQAPVERPCGVETTALGAAFLAGLAADVWEDLAALAATWTLQRRFEPQMGPAQREAMLAGWRAAVRQALLAA